MKQKSILLVGGGTGGHFIPVYQLYKKLKKNKALNVVVVGSGNELEGLYFNNNPDYSSIRVGKINRRLTLVNLFETVKTIVGLFQSLIIMLTIRPSLIFSKGGYVSFPIIFWAKLFNIPYFIHESDIEMGLSNRYAEKNADRVFVGFPTKYYSNQEKVHYVGQIISDSFINNEVRDYEAFGFKPRKTILVTGGSQGSSIINKNIFKILPEIIKSYNIIHQTGINDLSSAKEMSERLDDGHRSGYYFLDFLKNDESALMTKAVNIADVVIARAGATTISELAVKAKAMILIPYKHAASDHQTKNAKYLLDHSAALVISDDELTPETLIDIIDKAFNKKSDLGSRASNLFKKDGLSKIADEIYKKLDAI